jgi:group I intron endonuclease
MAVIYKIQNKLDGKCYIGVAKNYENRIKRHFRELQYNKHCNPYLQNVFNKYGNIFESSIIKQFDNLEQAFLEESTYIKKYGTYNISAGGIGGNDLRNHPNYKKIYEKVSNSLKGRDVGFSKGSRHTNEYKEYMSKIHSKSGNPNWKRQYTDEERLKLSKIQKERYTDSNERKKCNVFRDLTKEQLTERKKVWSECKKGKNNSRFKWDKKVIKINPETNEILKEYEYARLVQEDGFASKYVIACCNGTRKNGKYKGYIWKFVD